MIYIKVLKSKDGLIRLTEKSVGMNQIRNTELDMWSSGSIKNGGDESE